MIGLGTIINAGAIVAGGAAGVAGGRFLSARVQETLMRSTAVCVIFVGIAGAIEQMMSVHGAGLTSGGTARILIALAVGSIAGEAADLEGLMERFGAWVRAKSGNEGDGSFIDAFVTASLAVSIGAMGVVGSIQDGVSGAWGTLALKGALDALIVCVMAVSLGKGAIFSAIPVAIFEGGITLLARAIAPVLTDTMVNGISMVGSILIFCVGVNLVWPKTFRAANMLPAVIVAALIALF